MHTIHHHAAQPADTTCNTWWKKKCISLRY